MKNNLSEYDNVTCEVCGAGVQFSEVKFIPKADLPNWIEPAKTSSIGMYVCPFCAIDPDAPIPFRVTELGKSCLSNSTNLTKNEQL